MNHRKPCVLLIGVGRFGSKHLKTLLDLEKRGILTVAGAVVKDEESQKALQSGYKFPVYSGFSESILADVDAVDIVTPMDTHLDLITRCLPKVHVFVEKPMVSNSAEAISVKKLARKSKNVLMVGHIFRFHSAVIKLKEIVSEIKERPHSIEATFINSTSNDIGTDVELEMLHPFDIVDFLFKVTPIKKHTDDKGRLKIISLKYKGRIRALMKIGWSGENKDRVFKIIYKQKRIVCDLEKNIIKIYKNGIVEKQIDCNGAASPLEVELETFIKAIQSPKSPAFEYPDALVGKRIVDIATQGQLSSVSKSKKLKNKKIAIIGAGIFGTNCAIELGKDFDVTLFDKNKEIFTEASFINQYRHHWGYHYPRSQETIDDIVRAITDFEARYKKSIITKFPTYYSVAKKNSKVTAKEYVEFCDRNKLPYTIEYPDEKFINREKTSICLKTFEPIYDFKKLKKITENNLVKNHVKTEFNSEIIGARILDDGRKAIKIKKGNVIREEYFDYVLNVTYARYNNFCKWLDFPKKLIRLDLVETLWVKLNIPKISLAVMDGPFSNIVPTGVDGIFTLVHIKESVLRRFVPKDGLVPKNIFSSISRSRIKKIIEKSSEWFPIVKDVKVLKAHYVLRGVNAYREHDDARTSDITEHGFGCFSILGGKIINSVSIAKRMKKLILGADLNK